MFSRRGSAGKHARAEESRRPVTGFEDKRAARRAALLGEEEPQYVAATQPVDELPDGPFDFDDAPPAPRLDLGSLLLPAVDGVEVRVQAADNGVIQQVALLDGENALQLGVFAAPRSDGIWDDVREEIRKSLFADGVGAEEQQGRWGTELRARLRTADGFNDLRFVGVDGPRWMVRAVFQGPAAVDPVVAGPLMKCLAGLVVRRDDEARPVREPLPLRMPDDAVAQASDPAAPAPVDDSPVQPTRSDLVPGLVPPPPAPTPFGAPAQQYLNGAASGNGAMPSTNGNQPGSNGAAPRRKPSPRPRRDA